MNKMKNTCDIIKIKNNINLSLEVTSVQILPI